MKRERKQSLVTCKLGDKPLVVDQANAWTYRMDADELPPLISSIKDGWQLTGENGAVVSALLAGVAAQLLGFFKDGENYSHAAEAGQRAVVALCYWAIVFNIGAAISSFVMMDYLGELQFQAASTPNPDSLPTAGKMEGTAYSLLKRYGGASSAWWYMAIHWISCLFLGIFTLLLAILVYVWLEEIIWMKTTTLLAMLWIIVPPIVLLLVPKGKQ